MRNPLVYAAVTASLSLYLFSGCSHTLNDKPVTIEELAINVRDGSHEIAYTNKQAGFFYTETNAPHRNSWQGWNVMAKEILEDYAIVAGNHIIQRSEASITTVYPHQFTRKYPAGTEETVTLLDSVNAFVVQLHKLNDSLLAVRPFFKDADRTDDYIVVFTEDVLLIAHKRHLKRTPEENYPVWIGITFGVNGPSFRPTLEITSSTTGFSPAGLSGTQSPSAATVVFAAGDSEEQTVTLAHFAAKNYESLIAQRRQRMERILNQSFLRTDDEQFDKAFHWALLSMDALIMNQLKKGIFAGLPWFDNYWGRDSFIALPGATLVTGNFAEAKEILRSFADWQEKNPNNPNYGRIPNLVTTGSIAYNTTDGTPRFVIALEEYFRYSADTSFVKEMYPVVRRSIEGALTAHIDEHGFLKHSDAETWMDAAGPAGPWSPRGNRANDIQALWYRQLLSGAALAKLSNDQPHALLWMKIATTVRANFNKFFFVASDTTIADHLNADGTKDAQFRPNSLFALDLIDNQAAKAALFKHLTERLVYVHGVASLSQDDPNFHPYHHYEPYYVQDAAYHNGIVWTWLSGAWIDAAVSTNRSNLAFKVTNNMVHQILDRGAVGTLSELVDAAPRANEAEPRLSGTFSQAWSLSELLRVVYQDYLGIRVDAPANRLTLSPRLPSSWHTANTLVAIGHARVTVGYVVTNDQLDVTLQSANTGDSISVFLDAIVGGEKQPVLASLGPHQTTKITISHNETSSLVSGVRHILEPAANKEQVPNIEPIALAIPTIRPDLKSLKGPSHRLLSNSEAKAQNTSASTLYDVNDPEGDDKGGGGYSYPLTPLLKPGSLDIVHFTVSADEKYVYFRLRFRDLSNPGWHPEYGFQLTYVAIAVDKDGKKGSGSTEVGMNSNYVLDPRYAFESIIYVGGGVRVADAKGATLAEYIPVAGDERNPLGSTQSKEISFSIPVDVFGKPATAWHYTLLVGCQDDHGGAGIGDFRSVETTAKEWAGGGRKRPSDSNVYDVIFPLIK